MAKSNKNGNNNIKIITAIAVLLLALIAVGTWWAYSYSTQMVRDELTAQKIFFPAKGSPALPASEYPGLQQYAGQQVDDGVKAKAYANEYIGNHLKKIADGKTYAEVSSEAMKNPKDEKLAGQKQQPFMGETLRGLLLNAYAFWTIGKLLQVVSVVSIIGAVILGIVAGLSYKM